MIHKITNTDSLALYTYMLYVWFYVLFMFCLIYILYMLFIHPSLLMIKRRPIKSSTSASTTSLSAFTTSYLHLNLDPLRQATYVLHIWLYDIIFMFILLVLFKKVISFCGWKIIFKSSPFMSPWCARRFHQIVQKDI